MKPRFFLIKGVFILLILGWLFTSGKIVRTVYGCSWAEGSKECMGVSCTPGATQCTYNCSGACGFGCQFVNRECLWPGNCWKNSCAYGWDCGSCGGGCFVEGTEINIEQESKRAGEQEGSEAIENLKPGEIVSSFNPETGEISESQVSEVHKITREGYFELETESGKKVKVTGEHPFLAIKANNFQFPISNFQLIDKLKNALSNTLTFRLITGLQAKLVEILD